MLLRRLLERRLRGLLLWYAEITPRTKKMETSTPAKAMTAPAQNALTKPSVNAAGSAIPRASSSSVVETAIVDRRAMPRAPPIC